MKEPEVKKHTTATTSSWGLFWGLRTFLACYMKISSSSILILCPQYNFLRTFFEGKNFRLRTFSVIFQFWKEREYVGEREMCCNVKDIVINTVLPLCPEPSFVERVTHVVHLDCVSCKSIPFQWDKEEHGDVGEYCVDCVATHTLFCFVQISCLSFFLSRCQWPNVQTCILTFHRFI